MTRPVYPPEHHFLRDLSVTTERFSRQLTVCSAPVVPAIVTADGRPRAGIVAAIVDLAGAATALSSVRPGWIATADLAVVSTGAAVVGPIVVVARLLRAGSNVVVVRVEIGDGQGRDDPATMVHAGRGIMTFARIPGSASRSSDATIPESSPKQSMARPGSGFSAPVLDALGVHVVDAVAGTVEVELGEYVRNSFGSLNGGVIAVLAEAAADAALDASRSGLVALDLSVNYLSQTKAGPVRTVAEIVRRDAHHAVVEVHLVDAGNDDQLVATSTVGLHRV